MNEKLSEIILTASRQAETGKMRQPAAAKKPENRKRSNSVKFRLTDRELVKLRSRVARSGLTQSEFIRRAALTGQIILEEPNYATIRQADQLCQFHRQIYQQKNNLLRILAPHQGARTLSEGEWRDLIHVAGALEGILKEFFQ